MGAARRPPSGRRAAKALSLTFQQVQEYEKGANRHQHEPSAVIVQILRRADIILLRRSGASESGAEATEAEMDDESAALSKPSCQLERLPLEKD
jgi:hypothetical protein